MLHSHNLHWKGGCFDSGQEALHPENTLLTSAILDCKDIHQDDRFQYCSVELQTIVVMVVAAVSS